MEYLTEHPFSREKQKYDGNEEKKGYGLHGLTSLLHPYEGKDMDCYG